MASAIREARVNANNVEDGDDDIRALNQPKNNMHLLMLSFFYSLVMMKIDFVKKLE